MAAVRFSKVVLKGSWDLVSKVISRIAPPRELITPIIA